MRATCNHIAFLGCRSYITTRGISRGYILLQPDAAVSVGRPPPSCVEPSMRRASSRTSAGRAPGHPPWGAPPSPTALPPHAGLARSWCQFRPHARVQLRTASTDNPRARKLSEHINVQRRSTIYTPDRRGCSRLQVQPCLPEGAVVVPPRFSAPPHKAPLRGAQRPKAQGGRTRWE